MRDISLYLQDILDAMLAIEQFVEGISFDEFKTDDKTSSAVIRKFEIIGEAAKQIPEEIRNKYPLIPWKEMAGMGKFRDTSLFLNLFQKSLSFSQNHIPRPPLFIRWSQIETTFVLLSLIIYSMINSYHIHEVFRWQQRLKKQFPFLRTWLRK